MTEQEKKEYNEFLEMKKRLEDFTMQSISDNIQTLESNCI